ncbi:MAG: DUF1488 family protein [Parvibaculum sp.]|nr:DUF1488 family protein [Parvibaculum sp.]
MAAEISLAMQTAYADLVDRCAIAAFERDFAANGNFVAKTVRGRKYWYFQEATPEGRRQKYVGPETEELLEKIARHRDALDDTRDRQALVSMLVRSAYLPRPQPKMGQVLQALAEAGVFRLRAVLVGTLAYQTYAAMLGVRLPAASLQTGDLDIAQHRTISVAAKDKTLPPLPVLKAVDASFRPVPHLKNSTRSTSYVAAGGLRVDFLTPNRGAESGEPAALPALATDAHPLRFLDYLIHEPTQAVVLHGAGVHVSVPTPERYALHKLIVAQRPERPHEKRSKDIVQAENLLKVLLEGRLHDLLDAWQDAVGRGKKWKTLLLKGVGGLRTGTRDGLLKAVGETRSALPGVNLEFASSQARYDGDRDIVFFNGTSAGDRHRCAISREALEDYFGDLGEGGKSALEAFRNNRSSIENLLREKFLRAPVEGTDETLLTSRDIPALRKRLKK